MLLRLSLSVAPCFLWECLTSRTVSWFPAPAASNPSCRFPAMGLPAGFRSRVMRPTRLAGLSVMTRVDEAGCRSPKRRRSLNLVHVTCYAALCMAFISNAFLILAGETRTIQLPELGSVIELSEVGGLHHRYERHAA
jgi:hypothetical protein